jgi:hypothetical protein
MAESTKEVVSSRPKPKTAPNTPATTKKETAKSSSATEGVTTTPEAKPRFGFLRALQGGQAATKVGPDGKPRPANPSMSRFFLGMSLYMVLALGAQFVLAWVFSLLPKSYTTQALVTLPLLGAVTPYLLAWMATLILILYALYKFKILPRALGQAGAKTAAAKADPKAKAAPTAKIVRTPVEGPNDDAYARVKARIRAERRKGRRS